MRNKTASTDRSPVILVIIAALLVSLLAACVGKQSALSVPAGAQPEARKHLLAAFYETGEVDDLLFTYEPMDFSAGLGFPAIAKIALAVVLLIAAGFAWLIYRIVRRIVQRKATLGGIQQ